MKYNHIPPLVDMPCRQKVVVFTGAGISVESGLSTYRGSDSLAEHYDYQRLSSVSTFDENPQVVLEFHNMLRSRLAEVQPNHAHILLAELEKWHDITIITQNVDNLHERAGSSHVVHLHGELTKVTSSANRLDEKCITDYPLRTPIKLGDKAADGSQLRPYIVWFGEYLSNQTEVAEIIDQAEVFVVIGTSLTVYPAASFIQYARPQIPRFVIDPNNLSYRLPEGFIHIKETATNGVGKFVDELMKLH